MLYREQRSIAAADHIVYDLIANLSDYGDWNPWICHGEGVLEPGQLLQVTAIMGKKRPIFKHRLIAAQRPRLFHWCDVGWFTVFAYGERKRTIEAIDDNHCVYTVELSVTGFASALAQIFFGKFMREGLFNEASALKNCAELLANSKA